MGQSAQGEGVLIDILAFDQQLTNKVSAADVVHQVAEFFTAERVVAEVLDDSASVRKGMSLPDLVLRQSRISLEQEWADLTGPQQVHDFLVGQNRVRGRADAAQEHDEKKGRRAHGEQAPPSGYDTCECWRMAHDSNPSEQNENENDDENKTQSSGRGISPASAMRPSWQRADKC